MNGGCCVIVRVWWGGLRMGRGTAGGSPGGGAALAGVCCSNEKGQSLECASLWLVNDYVFPRQRQVSAAAAGLLPPLGVSEVSLRVCACCMRCDVLALSWCGLLTVETCGDGRLEVRTS